MRGILLILILLFSFSFAEAEKDIRKVRAIEFRDLKYVSKYEIINSADIYIKGDLIVIDIESLKEILKNIPIIRSFEIIEKDQKLVISVNESEPAFSLCVLDGDKNIPVELNKDFQIISAERMYKLNYPLVFILKGELKKEGISLRVKRFLGLINDLRNRNLKIIDDILEIKYFDTEFVEVMLKGRKTVFSLKPVPEAFYKMNYAVGYFDMIKYYPDKFTMLNGSGIVK